VRCGWIDFEPILFIGPCFTDKFVRGQALQHFQSFGEVVGHQESLQMSLQLIMEAFDRGFLDRSVHALDLAMGP
jgi:hypothetical protein